MKINRSDLSFTYDAHGYMLAYKGKNIGGAGVLNRDRRLSPKQREGNLQDFRASAEREIASLVEGRGQARMLEVIRQIDAAAEPKAA